MLYGNYTFACRFENETQLPEYKGSTFRGVFGRALKNVVCVLKRQECSSCLLKHECLYTQVFEPNFCKDSPSNLYQMTRPHPYVIQPPLTDQTLYPKGSFLNFNLLLFGPVTHKLPYFIYAIKEMGHIGIGKKINGQRGIYRLESVSVDGQPVYSGMDQKLLNINPQLNLTLRANHCRQNLHHKVTLVFQTPLRLKHNNHLTPELQFHVLVRTMLRRASSLLAAFGDGEPELDYSGMVERAKGIRTTGSTLKWTDWRRYSFRQDQAMMLGGVTGSITYEGVLTEYLPLMDFCAQVHLGKQTTFGLGRFSVEATK